MNNSAKIIQQISLLYELALTLGKSNDASETCRSFLGTLCSRKSLAFASVWVREESAFSLFYAHPSIRSEQHTLPVDTPIWEYLGANPFVSTHHSQANFYHFVHETGIEGGSYAVFKLQEWGFLKLYAAHRQEDFSSLELAQLRTVVNQFAATLSACFAYRRLERETRERKAAQKELASSKARIENLFQNMYDALIVQDAEGYIIQFNKAASNLVELENPEKKKYKLLEFVHPDDRKQAQRYAINRRKEGFFSDLELRILTSTGTIKYVQINSNAIYEDGKYQGARDVIRDITGQKLAERQLQENESKLRQVIDTSLDGVVIIDHQGLITEWSGQMTTIFGYAQEEAVGQRLSDLIMPIRHREEHAKGMDRYMGSGISHILDRRIELDALHKAGHEFPVELSVTHITIDGQDYFSGFVRDITERKKAENDLLEAKKTAEQAQMSERQFLANMSHEIRTPMNAVIGMTHLLYTTNPTKAQKEYLDSLQFSGDSLLGIINNILDLSKIEAGMLEFEKRKFDPCAILQGLQTTYQFKVNDKPVEVSLLIDSTIQYLLIGDPTRLTQILSNLLGNASKFTHSGFIRLRAQVVEQIGNTMEICFSVEDTGIGIPLEKQETIFQNFKQANDKVTRKYGGTGLGLSIVKQLVELQGGSIELQSTQGTGSVFRVYLPYEISEERITEYEVPKLVSKQSEEERLQASTILIAEDNLMNQRLIKKVFSIWKTPIELAENGLEALEMSRGKTYDLVLMDLHMPEMDGV
ncbi:MAG: PAS domain S-box protein, partial [Bacteroidota bacterium]